MNPYQPKAPTKRNLFQKLFNVEPQDNAYIAINNLLATKRVLTIERSEIQDILKKYGVEEASRSHKEELMKPLLAHVLLDGVIDEKERKQLRHLCHILNAEEKLVERLLQDLADELYRDAFAAAISDGYLSAEEEQELAALRQTLELDDTKAEALETALRKEYLEEQLQEALADQMLSPAEEKKLAKTASNLNTELNYSDSTQSKLRQYRRYWQLRYGALPALKTPYNLYKGEECYLQLPAEWCEWKTQTTRYNYGGPAVRVRVAKGLYWRSGSVGVQRMKEEVLKNMGSGELLLTNKRLLFIGDTQTRFIRLNRILDFDVYQNGLQIKKDAGKHPFLKITGDMSEIPLLMERLLEFE